MTVFTQMDFAMTKRVGIALGLFFSLCFFSIFDVKQTREIELPSFDISSFELSGGQLPHFEITLTA